MSMNYLSMPINWYRHLTKPAKAAIGFTVCNFLLKGISLISSPLFAHILPTDEYGLLSLYMASENIILILACWDIPYGAYQKGLFRYDDVIYFDIVTQLFTTITTVSFFGVIVIGYPVLQSLIIIPRELLWIFMVYALFQSSYRNWMVKQQSVYAYKTAVFVTLLNGIMTVVLPMCATLFYRPKADVKFTTQLLVSIVVFAYFYLINCHYFKVLKNLKKFWEQINFIIKFQFPCVFHSLSLVILSQADRVMIGNMVGNTQAAYYSVAYNLSITLSVITNSLGQVLSPWTFQMMKYKNYKNIRMVTNYLAFFFSIMIIVFILIAPDVIYFLFPFSYREAVVCIPPIAGSVYFMFLYGRFTCIEAYFEKTKYLMYISITCGFINIILNYIFIRKVGYVACAYTTLFSYIIFSVGHYWIMNRICKKNAISNLFSVPILTVISTVVLCMAGIMQIFYMFITIRYILILILLIVVLIFRKKIRIILRMMRNKGLE